MKVFSVCLIRVKQTSNARWQPIIKTRTPKSLMTCSCARVIPRFPKMIVICCIFIDGGIQYICLFPSSRGQHHWFLLLKVNYLLNNTLFIQLKHGLPRLKRKIINNIGEFRFAIQYPYSLIFRPLLSVSSDRALFLYILFLLLFLPNYYNHKKRETSWKFRVPSVVSKGI